MTYQEKQQRKASNPEPPDELDIEYDADYHAGTETEGKAVLFQSRNPAIRLEYASQQQLEKLSEEDQKLYAEIIYSWLTNRVDRVKQSHRVDYLFCVITDTEGEDAYKEQFFLFSGADPGAVRGLNYKEVYPLGHTVSVAENPSQQKAMQTATEHSIASTDEYGGYLASAGDFIDYYSYLTMIDNHAVIIGMTYDLSGIMNSIRKQTLEGTGYSMIYLVLLMTFIILNIFLFGIGPLKKITESIRRYAQSKDSEKIISELEANLNGIKGFAACRRDLEIRIDTVDAAADQTVEAVENGQDNHQDSRSDGDAGCAHGRDDADRPVGFPGEKISSGYEQRDVHCLSSSSMCSA